MSAINDTKLMTSAHLKRQLNSISTNKLDIKLSLLDVVERFQCLDRVAKSTGLITGSFSFVNRVAWEPVISALEKTGSEPEAIKLKDIIETVSQSSEQLENELVPQLQKWRNKWMLQVILIEFVFLVLLAFVVAGITNSLGLWSLSNISVSFQTFFYERPVFSLLAGILSLLSFVVIHFRIRNFVARQLVKTISKEESEFNLAGAFLKNTAIQHSIFRPDIVGWNWLSRKCLMKGHSAQR